MPIATEPSMHDPCADIRNWPRASTERRNSMQQFAIYRNVVWRPINSKNSEPRFLQLKFRCLKNVVRFNQCANNAFINRKESAGRWSCAGGWGLSRPLVAEISGHAISWLRDRPRSPSAGRVSSISGTRVSRCAELHRRGSPRSAAFTPETVSHARRASLASGGRPLAQTGLLSALHGSAVGLRRRQLAL